MLKLATLTSDQLDAWVAQARTFTNRGRLPDYIPQLARAKSSLIAITVQTLSGQACISGDFTHSFVMMSVIKPFLLLFLLEQVGAETVFQRVGMQPSDQPFHSMMQLTLDQGRPRNPMINSGAIALTALMSQESAADRCEAFRQWLNDRAFTKLVLDREALASVRSLPNETNRKIAEVLFQHKQLDHVALALDTYNQLCCLSGTINDLARLGGLLIQPQAGISPLHQRIVNALMLTCGLYEASGTFAVRIGLPMKSGVSGALLAVVPGAGAIACYAPAIDTVGNSVAGLFLVEKLAQEFNLSVFAS